MAITAPAIPSTAPPTRTRGARGRAEPRTASYIFSRVLGWASIWIVVVVTIFPFYWMIRTAFSTNRAMFSHPLSLLPVDPTLGPIRRVLGLSSTADALAEGGSVGNIAFGHYLVNSILVCTLITVFQVMLSAMAAYAFALLEWRGRDAVFGIFLVALLVPGMFTLLPNFLLVRDLGLLNSYIGIALPSMFFSPFVVFFLRQFFLGVNRSFVEAAVIDGAGQWRIFSRIALPMVMPQVITIGILQFIFYWNDYLWPLLIGQTEGSTLLTVGLGIFRSQTPQGSPDWAGLMAGALIAAIPVFVLVMVFGRRIVGSIQDSGVK